MKKVLYGILLLFVTLSVQSQEKKNKNARYTIDVNGNCDLCKKRIEKAAFSISGVKLAVWNVESHQLSLVLNEEKGTILDVKKAIAKVGHDTEKFRASDEVYKVLPECCLYRK